MPKPGPKIHDKTPDLAPPRTDSDGARVGESRIAVPVERRERGIMEVLVVLTLAE
jgi:hypothetical protein